MRACAVIYTFYIFKVLKVARIFDKNFGYDGYGVTEGLYQGPWNLC